MFDDIVKPTRRHDLERLFNDAVAARPSAWRQAVAARLESMDDWKRESEGRREHLGASAIGNPCARAVALAYRHACPEPGADGRMVRLFNRGHLEEARLAALFDVAGVTLKTMSKHGGQISYQMETLRGSVDGVCRLPDGRMAVVEFKTMNDRSFKELEKTERPSDQHFTQMQCAMQGLGLGVAIYVASCKNDDRIIVLEVTPEAGVADDADNLAFDICQGNVPAASLGVHCRWCPAQAVCVNQQPLAKTCRTCYHATTNGNNVWACGVAEFGAVCEYYEPIKLT